MLLGTFFDSFQSVSNGLLIKCSLIIPFCILHVNRFDLSLKSWGKFAFSVSDGNFNAFFSTSEKVTVVPAAFFF